MLNLDPGKLLVIGVVAIILLGPDRLPQVARQIGGAWKAFNEFRHRMEAQVRDTMPDLPDTAEIARLARSPSALLNHLSNMAEDEEPDGSFQPPDPESVHGAAEPAGDAASEPAAAAATTDGSEATDGTVSNGTVPNGTAVVETNGHVPPAPKPVAPSPDSGTVERSRRAPKPSGVIVPGDPTLN